MFIIGKVQLLSKLFKLFPAVLEMEPVERTIVLDVAQIAQLIRAGIRSLAPGLEVVSCSPSQDLGRGISLVLFGQAELVARVVSVVDVRAQVQRMEAGRAAVASSPGEVSDVDHLTGAVRALGLQAAPAAEMRRMCKFFMTSAGCNMGARCRFSHVATAGAGSAHGAFQNRRSSQSSGIHYTVHLCRYAFISA